MMSFFRGLIVICAGLVFAVPAYSLPNGVSYSIRAELDATLNIISGQETLAMTNHSGLDLETLFIYLYPNAFRRGSNNHYQQELIEKYGPGSENLIYANPADDAFMDVISVKANEQTLQFSIDDTIMAVELSKPLMDGESISLEISFVYNLMEGTRLDLMAFSHAIRSAHRDGVYTISLWYPRLAVLDESGWNTEPYSLIGEFYSDFADYSVEVIVPENFQVGATGRLQSEVSENSKRTLKFSAEKIHDFAWVASSRYHVESLEWNGITVTGIYADSIMSDLAERALSAIQFFSEQFGPYAYPTFTIAQVKTGGGMEYPGIIMIGQGTTREVVHEVAHQWWYGAVGNNEFDEAWLDEGFTTFSEELYTIKELGAPEEAARSSYEFHEPGEIVLQPASDFLSDFAYAAAVYNKGSGILWMLRNYLGEELFAQTLQGYYSQLKYQNSSTSRFVAVVEELTGQELDWFFDQWLRTTKRLDFSIEKVELISAGQSPDGAKITLRRAGEAVMPVNVQILFSSDRQPYTFRWDAAKESEEVQLDGIENVQKIVIDPARAVLEEDRLNNIWQPSLATYLFGVPMGLAVAAVWISWRFLIRVPHLRI